MERVTENTKSRAPRQPPPNQTEAKTFLFGPTGQVLAAFNDFVRFRRSTD
jgi:hypothetical protein